MPLDFHYVRIDKGDGSEERIDSIRETEERIAAHLEVPVESVREQVQRTGRIETDSSIYEYRTA